MSQDYYTVIVIEPDGLERVVSARIDQDIDPAIILWDERVSGGLPPAALLTKANDEDAKRKKSADDLVDLRTQALSRLQRVSNKDIEDLLIVLGLK